MGFQTLKEAADFRASRIVQEASLRHVPLSDLDRKMIYFCEDDAAAPGAEDAGENAEGDSACLESGKKIATLSGCAYRRDREQSPGMERLWREAIAAIKKVDPYLPTLYNVPRSARDIARLIATAILVLAAGFAAVFGFRWIGHHVRVTIPDSVQLAAFQLAILAFSYLGYNDKLTRRIEGWLGRIFERISGL